MSEPIKSQIISRRRIFLLAAMAAFAVPATMLPMSNAGAQQASDQAPADQTPPKPAEKKKKKKATPGVPTAPASSPPAPPKQQ
jgi:invasion protein IalB